MGFAKILMDANFEEKLRNKEIDLDSMDSQKRTLFIYAASHEKYANQLSLILRYHKEWVQYQTYTRERNALHTAVLLGNVKGLEVILQHGFNPNSLPVCRDSQKAIITATEKNNLEITKMLVKYGAKVNERTPKLITPLSNAVRNRNMEMIKFLVENNANVNSSLQGGAIIRMCIFRKHDEAAIYLAENGARLTELSTLNHTIIHEAASRSELSTLQYFYNKFPRIHDKTDRMETPLFSACRWGNYENAKFLLEKGAEVNIYNCEEESPLVTALMNGNIKLVNLLLEHGASLVLNYNKIQETLFNRIQNREVIELLINNGININVKNGDGTYKALGNFVRYYENIQFLNKYVDIMEPNLEELFLSNRFQYILSVVD